MRSRTLLFVPATRPERIDKALSSGADRVVVDLEDAVAPDEKALARRALGDWLARASHPVIVRVNGTDTEWFREDAALCGHPKVQAVMLPKAADPRQLSDCAAAAPAARIIPLIETAVGFRHAEALCAHPSVERLAFGTIDFQVDLGLHGDGAELDAFRSQLVLVSRLHLLEPPIDGVSLAIDSTEALERDANRSRRMGFAGKLCIHPRQVATVQACFTPAAAEVEWAERVVGAFASSGGGVVTVDGRMVDKPVLLQARRILQAAS